MKHKPYFLESRQPTFPWSRCDRCDLLIAEVADGKTFWNPNTAAYIRKLCRNCYEAWRAEKLAKALAWRAKAAAMNSPYNDKKMSNAALAALPSQT